MNYAYVACAVSLLLVTVSVAQSAEHIPGTASSRPAATPAKASQVPPLSFLIYDTGPDARHANLMRGLHSSASTAPASAVEDPA